MSSALTKRSSWLAGDPRCLAHSCGPREPSGIAAPRPWVGISRSAIGADIPSSYITRAAIGMVPSARLRHAHDGWNSGEAELLPAPYFHVVFTLPKQIGYLALQNARTIYNLLFRAAAQTLLETAADPRLLGASIGFLAVLHTWGQNLHLHPHLHCVFPGGGISPDGSRWIACRKDSFFLPHLLLSQRFRKNFLRQLQQAFRHGALRFTGEQESLACPAAFEALCEKAAKIQWVVHIKPPFGGPQRVLKYLARYTHRVAISNHRLRALENHRFSFEWKDYAQQATARS